MSDERILREALEALGAQVKELERRIEGAEAARTQREQRRSTELPSLRARIAALATQLEAMERLRREQQEELERLEASLARARSSIPAALRVPSGSSPTSPTPNAIEVLYLTFFGQTPLWARDRSWLGRLWARLLESSGSTWK